MSALIPALIELAFPGVFPLGRGGGGGGGGGGRGGAPKTPKPPADPMDKSANRQLGNMMDDSLEPKGSDPLDDALEDARRRHQHFENLLKGMGG